jgi:hypothetical protein
MLDLAGIVPYLLRHGLLDKGCILESDLTIYETFHRNSVFKIASEHGTSCMVKQGSDEVTAASIDHEASIYNFLGSLPTGCLISTYIPKFYSHDPQEHIIVIELLHKAEDLEWRHRRVGRFSAWLASELGRALGALHFETSAKQLGDKEMSESYYLPPGILSIHRPPLAFYFSTSMANLQLIGVVQSFPELGEIFDELRADWQMEALIHGDVKWSNLIASPAGKGGRPGLKIVDWEFGGRGDPCWDVGSVFNDYLSLWLLSIPITGKTPPDRFLELARYPLLGMQPSMRAFWTSYTRTMKLDPPTAARYLERAVRFCGARLAQSAFEQSQADSELNGNLVYFLQLSLNIMRRPRQAATRLLGIRIPWSIWPPVIEG